MELIVGWTWFVFLLDLTLRLVFSYRILVRRLSVGVTWAWLGLILLAPFVGTCLYLLFGEYRLGRRRTARIRAVHEALNRIGNTTSSLDLGAEIPERFKPFSKAVESLLKSPIRTARELRLLRNADEAFAQMILDIQNAKKSCTAEFYIWSDGGRADDFGQALIEAAARGVKCRVLLDAVGSASFLKGPMCKRLRNEGVDVQVALPSGIMRTLVARPDLRLHRKIFVIDSEIAYTGSLNLADPIYFKKETHVGQWVDALVRIQGPAVSALQTVFLGDWAVETGDDVTEEARRLPWSDPSGGSAVQVMPSGPAIEQSSIEQALILALYMAREQIVLTTPYFIPSEAMLYALMSAANRGVQVTLIVPEKVDSRLTQNASQAFFKDLARAGVRVAMFGGGLLHTKAVVIDGTLSLFGSLNLDARSLRINFEITLAIYDAAFAQSLLSLTDEYLEQSKELRPDEVGLSVWSDLKQSLARLVSPLL